MPSADGTAGGPALRYHQLHRLGRTGWSRVVFGLALAVLLFLVFQTLLVGVYAAIGEPFDAVSTDPLTPIGLTVLTLSLAAAAPIVLLVTRVIHDLDPHLVLSVVGRIRWRWLFVCLGLSAIAIVATVLLSLALPDQGGTTLEGSVNKFTRESLAFTLIVVFLIPLQSAGEEFAFRGYLTQLWGGLLRGRIGTAVALLVPALLFALAHGAQNAPVFLDRFAFGLVAGALVILTGGLEAGIAMHVLNNWSSFGLALVFGDIAHVATPDVDSWWLLPGTLVQSLGYLALVAWAARRRGLETSAEPGVLEAKRPRV